MRNPSGTRRKHDIAGHRYLMLQPKENNTHLKVSQRGIVVKDTKIKQDKMRWKMT